jgi:hypothetical protein
MAGYDVSVGKALLPGLLSGQDDSYNTPQKSLISLLLRMVA